MRYLLDTHAWIWSAFDDPRLSPAGRRAIARGSVSERLGLASISLKEAAWHLSHGRIALEPGIEWPDWLREAVSVPELEVLPLTVEVAIEAERFPESFAKDPADRLIAATALVHDLVLVTADRSLRDSPHTRTVW